LNGTHNFLAYNADNNILGQIINVINKKNTGLLDVSREVGLIKN